VEKRDPQVVLLGLTVQKLIQMMVDQQQAVLVAVYLDTQQVVPEPQLLLDNQEAEVLVREQVVVAVPAKVAVIQHKVAVQLVMQVL
jgi:hypothetical protein